VDNSARCDDNNVCTTDSCDPATGCVNSQITCADTDPCTTDSCDPASGCTFTPIPECGGQGCTPGFWKANIDQLGGNAWPVAQTVKVGDVFTLGSCGAKYAGLSLRSALSLKGGSSLDGAVQILLRIGTGAYLNSVSDCVNYGQTEQQVVDAVNAALATCTREALLSLGSTLDALNNAGCPIDQQGACTNAD
jgi:hypothetical protein